MFKKIKKLENEIKDSKIEIKDLKEENNAFRSVIDTYNIPNNLDTRYEVE